MSGQGNLFGQDRAPAEQGPTGHEVWTFKQQVDALIDFYRDRRPRARRTEVKWPPLPNGIENS